MTIENTNGEQTTAPIEHQATAPVAAPSTEAPEMPETPAADAAPEAETEALGEGGQKALQREREARRAAEAEAREHRERTTALEARVQEMETAQMRAEVARSRRLTDEQAALLVGDDVEQMGAHADALLAAFAPRSDRRYPREALIPLRSGLGGPAVPARTAEEIASEVLRG